MVKNADDTLTLKAPKTCAFSGKLTNLYCIICTQKVNNIAQFLSISDKIHLIEIRQVLLLMYVKKYVFMNELMVI